jgi:hypothetical protein
MRWALYSIATLAAIVLSFWGYLWIHRIDFLKTALTRACPPYIVTIESVEIQDSQTVVIKNLSVCTKENAPRSLLIVSQATACTTTASWLCWLLTPSQAPLHLRNITLTVTKRSPLVFASPSPRIHFSIDTLHVKGPLLEQVTYHSIQDSPSTILARISSTND